MIEVLLNPFDDSVLDMNNFIRLIGYTAFMCHYYDGHSRFVDGLLIFALPRRKSCCPAHRSVRQPR